MTPAKSPDAPAGTAPGLPEDAEIAEVEVEEVSSVAVTRVTEPTARATGVWQFPDDFLDGDTPPGGEPEAAPPSAEVPSPPSPAPRVRHKPPKNGGEKLLGGLIAIALIVLLGLGAYLFFLIYPESYAAFRERLPAEWTFLPEGEGRKERPPAEE